MEGNDRRRRGEAVDEQEGVDRWERDLTTATCLMIIIIILVGGVCVCVYVYLCVL